MSVSLLSKWRVLQAMFADDRLRHSAAVVGGVLLDFLNTETLQCNPSAGLLEGKCGLKRRAVLGALDELRTAGWVVQRRRRGTSCYSFPALDEVHQFAPLHSAEMHQSAPVISDEVHSPAPHPAEEMHHPAPVARDEVHETACLQVHETAPLYRNREYETGKDREKTISPTPHRRTRSGPSETEIDAAFAAWWPRNPKLVDKLGARRHFGRILKAGIVTVEELTAGAERYRTLCQARGTERRFIKSPEVWLSKGCWADEHEPLTSQKPPAGTAASRDWSSLDFGQGSHPTEDPSIVEAEFSHVE